MDEQTILGVDYHGRSNVMIAKLAQEIGGREMSIRHGPVGGVINEMARRDLKVFARKLLELLKDTPDVLEEG